jgi:hemoglobin-like flavoprotein
MTPLSSGEIELVRASFLALDGATETVSTAFYQRLFLLDRSLRRLFHGDMRQLSLKFIRTLGVIVNNLERLDEFRPYVRELGARHAGYHVGDEHYGIVGVALIGTLGYFLGDRFTPETRAAWTKVYTCITEQMIAGAHATSRTVTNAPA